MSGNKSDMTGRNRASAWMVCLWFVMCVFVSGANAQSVFPQPRVAYAMHSARINQIRATPDRTQLVTASEDKTVRIWRMADLRLMRTLQIPSEAGEEGAIRSLAITPDGREVIVGGWTGIAWHQRGQLYRFDLTTGRLLQTIRGFPSLIESLSISMDGRRLAVGLGAGGLQIIDLPTGHNLYEDKEYTERVTFADFSVDGRLATTSQDGCLRVYSPQHQIVFRAEYPPRTNSGSRACQGSELGGVRFSPDGKLLAFGLQDRNEMVVMDAGAMTVVRSLRVNDPQQQSLCCLNWSTDSSRLFMNGSYAGSGPTPLYRVMVATGAIERLDVGQQNFTNMLPLANGDVVFSTNAPSLARLDANGRRVAESLPPNGDFRFAWQNFKLSADGTRMTLPMRADGSAVCYFGIEEEPDRAYRPAEQDDVANTASPWRGSGVRVEAVLDDYGYKSPVRLNGITLKLKHFQSVRSWAGVPQQTVVVLGTQWSVMLVNGDGRILWERDLPAPAYQVNISANGRWVVAAIGDGSIRWYARETGEETIGLFLHANGHDWVAWRSDGYYASSPGGDEYIGWLVNRGDDQAPDFYRAVQFERTLYRPDLLRAALAPGPSRSLSRPESLSAVLKQLAPPRVAIEKIDRQGDGALAVSFSIENSGKPVREVGIYADGIPMLSGAERLLAGGNQQTLRGTLRLPANVSPDTIRIEAETDVSIGVDETTPLVSLPAQRNSRGKLRILAIGVGEFEDTRKCGSQYPCRVSVADLENAANDAEALADRFGRQLGQQFESVERFVLTDHTRDKPTKKNILARLKELERAGPNDTTIVFLASHGFAQSASSTEYYFVPKDGLMRDLEGLLAGNEEMVVAPSLLTATELNAALKRVAGLRLLVIDTCHSAIASGKNNPYSLAKRSAAAQLGVLSAASGDEESYEAVGERHGAFTHAFLEALDGKADTDRNGVVTVAEVFQYTIPVVAENMRQLNEQAKQEDPGFVFKTQTPTLAAIPTIEKAGLARVVTQTGKLSIP